MTHNYPVSLFLPDYYWNYYPQGIIDLILLYLYHPIHFVCLAPYEWLHTLYMMHIFQGDAIMFHKDQYGDILTGQGAEAYPPYPWGKGCMHQQQYVFDTV